MKGTNINEREHRGLPLPLGRRVPLRGVRPVDAPDHHRRERHVAVRREADGELQGVLLQVRGQGVWDGRPNPTQPKGPQGRRPRTAWQRIFQLADELVSAIFGRVRAFLFLVFPSNACRQRPPVTGVGLCVKTTNMQLKIRFRMENAGKKTLK